MICYTHIAYLVLLTIRQSSPEVFNGYIKGNNKINITIPFVKYIYVYMYIYIYIALSNLLDLKTCFQLFDRQRHQLTFDSTSLLTYFTRKASNTLENATVEETKILYSVVRKRGPLYWFCSRTSCLLAIPQFLLKLLTLRNMLFRNTEISTY